MDFFDERILEALKDGSPRTFPSLVGQVGFSHNTLQHHLKRLTAKRLVIKQKTRVNGFARAASEDPGSRIKFHLAAGNRWQKHLKIQKSSWLRFLLSGWDTFAGLRRADTAKKRGRTARLKSAPKPENKTYGHFTPFSEQPCALKDSHANTWEPNECEKNGKLCPFVCPWTVCLIGQKLSGFLCQYLYLGKIRY